MANPEERFRGVPSDLRTPRQATVAGACFDESARNRSRCAAHRSAGSALRRRRCRSGLETTRSPPPPEHPPPPAARNAATSAAQLSTRPLATSFPALAPHPPDAWLSTRRRDSRHRPCLRSARLGNSTTSRKQAVSSCDSAESIGSHACARTSHSKKIWMASGPCTSRARRRRARSNRVGARAQKRTGRFRRPDQDACQQL